MSDRRPIFRCASCSTEVRFLPGFTIDSKLPTGWIARGRVLLCPSCQGDGKGARRG